MEEDLPQQTKATQLQKISLLQLLYVYLLIGIAGIGPTFYTEINKHMVKNRKWIREEDFVNGIALAQVLPGATYVSVSVYIGYKLRGIAGAITGFFAFLIPSFFIMLLLSYIYFDFGSLPQINIIFKGLAVIVSGLLPYAILEMRKTAVNDWRGGIIAIIAIGMTIYLGNIFVLLFMGIILGIILYYHPLKNIEKVDKSESTFNSNIMTARTYGILLGIFLIGFVFIILANTYKPILLQLGVVFFRMGAILFGGGISMIPFMQQEVVYNYHWLTQDELVAGIALGQVTPGPFLITATFVGYKVASVSGAITSSLCIFLPSLFFVITVADIHEKIKHNLWVRAGIKGIAGAFMGMMVVIAAELIVHSVRDIPSAILALLVFAMQFLNKLDTIWIVIGGTLVYWIGNILFAWI